MTAAVTVVVAMVVAETVAAAETVVEVETEEEVESRRRLIAGVDQDKIRESQALDKAGVRPDGARRGRRREQDAAMIAAALQ
uniref:Secreted protein n=1 Tax=Oryza punctata TaxID=4537 RepID=A0A0E0KW42_ORYPU